MYVVYLMKGISKLPVSCIAASRATTQQRTGRARQFRPHRDIAAKSPTSVLRGSGNQGRKHNAVLFPPSFACHLLDVHRSPCCQSFDPLCQARPRLHFVDLREQSLRNNARPFAILELRMGRAFPRCSSSYVLRKDNVYCICHRKYLSF